VEPPAAPMLTGKGADTRRRIVAAAARLMFRHGVPGTTVEHVRAEAQVSSSQIYHYFADKQALVQAVIAYQDETVVGGQELMLAELDTAAGLRAWFDFLIEDQRRRACAGCPIGLLAAEPELDGDARTSVAAALARWENGIHATFREMYSRGQLREDADPEQLASATLAAVQGALLLTRVRRTTEALEAARDMVLGYVAHLTEPAFRPSGDEPERSRPPVRTGAGRTGKRANLRGAPLPGSR